MNTTPAWRPLWARVLAVPGLLAGVAVLIVGAWLAVKGVPMLSGPYYLGGTFALVYATVTLLGGAASLWWLVSFLRRGGAIRLGLGLVVIAFFVVLYTAISPIF